MTGSPCTQSWVCTCLCNHSCTCSLLCNFIPPDNVFPPNSVAIIEPLESPGEHSALIPHYLLFLWVSAIRLCVFSLGFAVPSLEFRGRPGHARGRGDVMLPIAMATQQRCGEAVPMAKGRHAPGPSAGNRRQRDAGQCISTSHRHVLHGFHTNSIWKTQMRAPMSIL